ncbi:MAG: YciI family protein [Pseudomonadota bacterium]
MGIKHKIRNAQLGFAAMLSGVAFSGAALADNHGAPQGVPPEVADMVKDMLSMELYFYETVAGDNIGLVMENMVPHLEYQIELEKKGVLFGAGPIYNQDAPSGPPRAGLIIVRASSMEEAKAIADADPMHSSGARTYTLRRWILNEGALNMTVTFSDKGADVK